MPAFFFNALDALNDTFRSTDPTNNIDKFLHSVGGGGEGAERESSLILIVKPV